MRDPYIHYARQCEVMRRCQEEFDHRLPPEDLPDGCNEDDYEPDDDDILEGIPEL